MKHIDKDQIAADVASMTGLSLRCSMKAVRATVLALSQHIAALDKVTLHGLGSFGFKRRSAHLARNPRTGDAVLVLAHRKIDFRPSKSLRAAVLVACPQRTETPDDA